MFLGNKRCSIYFCKHFFLPFILLYITWLISALPRCDQFPHGECSVTSRSCTMCTKWPNHSTRHASWRHYLRTVHPDVIMYAWGMRDFELELRDNAVVLLSSILSYMYICPSYDCYVKKPKPFTAWWQNSPVKDVPKALKSTYFTKAWFLLWCLSLNINSIQYL